MSNEEIIKLLKDTRESNPQLYEQYLNFYKEKYPDFYKNTIIPNLESPPLKAAEPGNNPLNNFPANKPEKARLNPADAFNNELEPLGSANVGEDLTMKDEAKEKKPSIIQSSITVEKKNTNGIIIAVVSVVILVLVAAVIWKFTSP